MATDQEIRDAGFKFIPQQKYLLNPFEIPTPPTVNQPPPGQTGIFATDAGSDWNPEGNLFGYGTAVQPGDKSVITSGPYAGQSGYYNSINYTGGLPGDVAQKGPGRYFQYEFTRPNADGDLVNIATGKPATGEFYKDYTLQPEKELPSWMKAGLAILPGGRFLTGAIENRMNPGKTGMTAAEIDKAYGTGEGGGTYGIAGLSDTQKQYYDALASQGFLYDGPGGMKTLDGKNFSQVDEDTINDYFQSKIDKHGSLENYEKYIEEEGVDEDEKKRKNLKRIYKQYKTLQGINDLNAQKAEDKFNNAFDATSPPNNDPNQDHDNDGVPNNVEAAGGSYDGGYYGSEGGLENTGSSGWSGGSGNQGTTPGAGLHADYSQGGRVYLNLGGLASIL